MKWLIFPFINLYFRLREKILIHPKDNILLNIRKMEHYQSLSDKYKSLNVLHRIFNDLVIYQHRKIYKVFSCDITPGAVLGDISFRHPVGIVIGGGAKVADNVIIHQNVTLGALKFDPITKRGLDCRQIIGENTIICAGAMILGNVVVGKNCVIGANAVVTRDVPDNSTVVGFNRVFEQNKTV